MKCNPVVAMIWEGLEAVDAVRKIVGTTKARGAEAGTSVCPFDEDVALSRAEGGKLDALLQQQNPS